MKTIFVETEQVRQMISYNPYVKTTGDKKNVKYKLLDGIREALGDKWYRLKDGTRQTFDMICFLSVERGFFYATDTYLADRHNISDRTVRNRFKELEKLGKVIKVNKRSKKCNGKGKAMYLFVDHPYFSYWVDFLKLESFLADFRTENNETACESKDKEGKRVFTFSLTKKQEKNNNISDDKIVQYVYNRVKDAVNKGTTIKYLSSYIDRTVRSLEKQALYEANIQKQVVKQQYEKQASVKIGEIAGIRKQSTETIPFYNWLES